MTKMAANDSEKAFCVLTFHECRSVSIVQRQFLSMRLRQGSDLCSASSRKYPGTEGTNQNRH